MIKQSLTREQFVLPQVDETIEGLNKNPAIEIPQGIGRNSLGVKQIEYNNGAGSSPTDAYMFIGPLADNFPTTRLFLGHAISRVLAGLVDDESRQIPLTNVGSPSSSNRFGPRSRDERRAILAGDLTPYTDRLMRNFRDSNLDVERVSLFGPSLGGALAVWAADSASRLGMDVISVGSYANPQSTERNYGRLVLDFLPAGKDQPDEIEDGGLTAMTRSLYFSSTGRRRSGVERFVDYGIDIARAGYTNALLAMAMAKGVLPDTLNRLDPRTSVTLVAGEEDKLAPAPDLTSTFTARGIESYVIKGAGHSVFDNARILGSAALRTVHGNAA